MKKTLLMLCAGLIMAYGPLNSVASISITAGTVTTTMVYDAQGNRVKKTAGSNPATIYVGKLYECSAGNCTKYIFAGGQRLAMVNGSATYYYHPDHLGSSNIVTDGTTRAVVQSLVYQPYGDTYPSGVAGGVRHKYTGQELDDSTGLYYYQARYYDPTLGRFIQADTLVPSAENPQAWNRYAYVLNNPIIYIDPTGHEGVQPYLDQILSGFDWLARFMVPGQDAWGNSLASYQAGNYKAAAYGFARGAGEIALTMATFGTGPAALSASRPLTNFAANVAMARQADEVAKGATVYRQGTFADDAIGWEGNYVKGKQWATDNPLTTPGYAKKYGLPAENTSSPNWVVKGRIEGPYSTRPAPASHNNPANTGGGTEILPNSPNDVKLDWFHMPD